MPRSPLSRRRSRSVVVRRSARLPMARPRPLVTRYGPVEAHQMAPGGMPVQRTAHRWAPADGGEWPTTVLPPVPEPPPDDEPPTAVFNPGGLVAWALSP